MNKRRTAKPFTVEIKKRGRRRENDQVGIADDVTESGSSIGRDIRFREIDNLFRNGFVDEPTPPTVARTEQVAPEAGTSADSQRRILVDLVAEAAFTEATRAASPEPRRRGRPPKQNVEALPRPAKRRGRPPAVSHEIEMSEAEPVREQHTAVAAMPAILHLAASARRRAARDTRQLPRSERWKRRLPKACW